MDFSVNQSATKNGWSIPTRSQSVNCHDSSFDRLIDGLNHWWSGRFIQHLLGHEYPPDRSPPASMRRTAAWEKTCNLCLNCRRKTWGSAPQIHFFFFFFRLEGLKGIGEAGIAKREMVEATWAIRNGCAAWEHCRIDWTMIWVDWEAEMEGQKPHVGGEEGKISRSEK